MSSISLPGNRRSVTPNFIVTGGEVHGPIAKKVPQLRRYIQSHRIPFAGADSTYDGAAEVWIDNEAAMADLRQSPEYLKGALADEFNFIDMNRVEWLVTNDRVILD